MFLWRKIGRYWYGTDGSNALRVGQDANVEALGGSEVDLFRKSDDMDLILGSISKDETMRAAIRRHGGMRVLRQDPFQCLISFIISANSSMKKIAWCLERLCSMCGDEVEFGDVKMRLFPTPEDLAGLPEERIRLCGLGYRSGFVREAAKMVSSGQLDLDSLRGSDYHSMRDALCSVPGVGYKVADCVMLFSLDMMEAVPLDRWVRRIILDKYPSMIDPGPKTLTPAQYDRIHDAVVGYFGRYAGYAQQFLFKADSGANWQHSEQGVRIESVNP